MTDWHPIETAPLDREILVYQRAGDPDKREYWGEAMVIGTLEKWEHRKELWFTASHVGGYEYECDLEHPHMWAEKPEPPK